MPNAYSIFLNDLYVYMCIDLYTCMDLYMCAYMCIYIVCMCLCVQQLHSIFQICTSFHKLAKLVRALHVKVHKKARPGAPGWHRG